ncbi:MAG TPA: hypothetical protein VFO55_11570 [Gemmatimonadaceae bacterium]|nr:hypothetical protein [Gemmatimonadaceae bacterium]
MRRVSAEDGSLRVYGSGLVPLLAGSVMIAGAIVLLTTRADARGQVAGGLAILLLGVLCLGVAEWSVFEFDAPARVLRWVRKSAFRRAGGVIPFDDIQQVVTGAWAVVDTERGTVPSKRVVLVTRQGRVPLTTAYSGVGGQEECAAAIRQVLARPKAVDSPVG